MPFSIPIREVKLQLDEWCLSKFLLITDRCRLGHHQFKTHLCPPSSSCVALGCRHLYSAISLVLLFSTTIPHIRSYVPSLAHVHETVYLIASLMESWIHPSVVTVVIQKPTEYLNRGKLHG